MTTKRQVFYVDETMKTPQGYVPSLVTEDEPGFSPMIGNGEHARPWYWGDTIEVAREICEDANRKLGYSPEEARKIVESSITAQTREDAAQQEKQERWENIKRGRAQ